MKKLFVITALVLATALYVLIVAKSYEYIDVYSTKSGESSVRMIGVSDPIKGGYVEANYTSFYTCPKGTSTQELYDKNVEDTDETDYYYAFGVESSCKSSYLATNIQNDDGG